MVSPKDILVLQGKDLQGIVGISMASGRGVLVLMDTDVGWGMSMIMISR